MRRNYILFVLFIFLPAANGFAETNDSTSTFKVSGYIDAYYAHFTDSVGTGNYQKFPSISPRSDEFGLNTAQLSFQYDAERFRGYCKKCMVIYLK